MQERGSVGVEEGGRLTEERTAWKSGIVLLQLRPFHSGSFQFLTVILMNASRNTK